MRPNLQPLQPTHAASTSALARRVRPAFVATIVLAAAAFATLASAPSTSPAATLAGKQAQAARLGEQVAQLEGRYDELQERHRGARYELERVRAQVAAARRQVLSSRRDLDVAKVRLSERAGALYRSGGSGSDIAELVQSGSFSAFFARVEMIRRIGDQDTNVLQRVEQLNVKVERRERTLRTARSQAAAVAARAQRDKQRMGAVLAQREQLLESVNADIRAIMERQRRAAQARAAAAARESASLARTRDHSSSSARTAGSSRDSSDEGSSTPTPAASGAGGSSVPLPPGSGTAAAAAGHAMRKIGSPYVWAASGPNSFDCSGLVTWAFAQAGRPGLPHSTYALINMGVAVPMDQLQVGDLLFSASVGHMGMYVGNNSFVHAPRTGDVVKVTSLSDYSMATARRI